MFDHRHRCDKYILLMHITTVMHHVRRIDGRSICSYITVDQKFGCEESETKVKYRIDIEEKEEKGRTYVRREKPALPSMNFCQRR